MAFSKRPEVNPVRRQESNLGPAAFNHDPVPHHTQVPVLSRQGSLKGTLALTDYKRGSNSPPPSGRLTPKRRWHDTYNRGRDMAKTFARFSVAYGCAECAFGKLRGKHDAANHFAGGAVTSMALAARQGPMASVLAGVAGGIFCGSIDVVMEHGFSLDAFKDAIQHTTW